MSLYSIAGGRMSLSLVTGTEVPETANGVVTPVPAENGTVPVKCGGSRVPCSGDLSPDGSPIDTDNHIRVENKVHDGEGRLETYNNGKTCSVTDASLPGATRTEHSRDTDVPEDSDAAETPDAAPPGDPAHCKRFSRQGDQATAYRQQMEAEAVDGDPNSREEGEEEDEEEEEDGEKEKQDEEEDEKNEKKWIHQRSGGRAEVKVSGLNYFQLYYITSGPERAGQPGKTCSFPSRGGIFSLHSTTRPRLLAPAPRPRPLLHLLLCPLTTAPAPSMSWPRCGCATSGACRTARAWMKSVRRVEVNVALLR